MAQWLKSEGRKESTVLCVARKLRYLARHCDLNSPEKVKTFIAGLACSDGHKDNLVDCYSHYAKLNGLEWTKPKYQREERLTRIPREEQINKVISHSSLRYATAYAFIRDCGLRPVELGMLRVKDVDLDTGKVYPVTAKHGSGRVLKLRGSTLAMFKEYVRKAGLQSMDLLWNCKRVKENWGKQKGVVARLLGEPELARIRLYALRHFAGSMAYNRTKDIIYTMQFLGHKSIKNTLRYIHLVNFDNEAYVCKVAKTLEEASALVEQGFEYVTEIDGAKLFRKPK